MGGDPSERKTSAPSSAESKVGFRVTQVGEKKKKCKAVELSKTGGETAAGIWQKKISLQLGKMKIEKIFRIGKEGRKGLKARPEGKDTYSENISLGLYFETSRARRSVETLANPLGEINFLPEMTAVNA